ncbi:MAG TPA: hypothetical protein VIV60_16555 [Polyangiaceae bacterium]
MSWQEATLFALRVYAIAAVVSMAAAAVLYGTFKVLSRLSKD